MAIQDFTAGQVLTAAQMDALQANDYNQTVSTKTDNYVLVAADKGTRVVMNAGTNKTFTVNSGLFSAGDTLILQNIGAGSATVTAGTCTVTTAGSLALAQWGGGTLYFTSASAAIFFPSGGITYGTATGGSLSVNITVDGIAYTYLKFTTDANLTVSKAGLFDVLMVGGGGGSGYSTGAATGGGGAGAVVQTTVYLPAATIAVDIGAGGAGGTSDYYSIRSFGYASSIGTYVYANGGGQGGGNVTYPYGGGYGGSGGGSGSLSNSVGFGLTNLSGQGGNNGSNSTIATAAGGGGGYASAGGAVSANVGGAGGTGLSLSAFTGTYDTSFISGGGGGAGATTGGAGGSSVGGAGVTGSTAGNNGAVNTGSGAGGNYNNITTYGSGGSGLVWVRFKI
jgi:hypothetical protein